LKIQKPSVNSFGCLLVYPAIKLVAQYYESNLHLPCRAEELILFAKRRLEHCLSSFVQIFCFSFLNLS